MSLTDFLIHATRLTYAALGLLTLIGLARHRDRARLDVALFFGALAFVLGVQEYFTLANVRPMWLVKAIQLMTLTHPYLMLRILENLRPAPRWVGRAALIGLVVSLVIWLPFPGPVLALNLLTVGYLVAVDLYAMVSLVRGALTTRGITRRRLQFGALGVALIVAAFVTVGVDALLPSFVPVGTYLVLIFAVGSGLAFYASFAAPRFLRHHWQLAQLERFLNDSIDAPADEPVRTALERLCQAALRASGGHVAFVVTRGENGQPWTATAGTDEAQAAWWAAHWPERWQQAVQRSQPVQLAVDRQPLPSSQERYETVLLVPLGARRDVLTVLLRHRPLFLADDLSLLHLLSTHSALVLDQKALIGQLRDHTADLETANQELEAFAYSVSHDLRTPLRHIEGFAELLASAPAGSDSGQHYLRQIREAALRMGHMIEVFLGFSRLGRAELNASRVPLNGLVAQIVVELEPETRGREVVWKIEALPEVLGDPMLLRRVWSNLLGNALKYTRTRPIAQIEVGSAPQEPHRPGQVTVYVRDNGVGFDPAYASRLFTVFQRLHHSSEFEGDGLGLAIVRRIVQRHHGRVWAEGVPGRGATFFLTLPLAQAQVSPPGLAAASQPETKNTLPSPQRELVPSSRNLP
jgi:signal transduction histidine kinase